MPVAGLRTGRIDGRTGSWRELDHVFLVLSVFMILKIKSSPYRQSDLVASLSGVVYSQGELL